MSRQPTAERLEAEDPLFALLGANERALPRPEFRSGLRDRLTTSAPPSGAAARGPLGRVLVGSALIAGVAMLVVTTWMAVRPVPSVPDTGTQIGAADVGAGLNATGETNVASGGPTRAAFTPVPTNAPTELEISPRTDAPVAVATSLPATATGESSPTPGGPPPAVVGASPEPLREVPTHPGDVPEQTPRPAATTTPTATSTDVPTGAPTSPFGSLPATPTPAPTGPGWPTLPPPPGGTPAAPLGPG